MTGVGDAEQGGREGGADGPRIDRAISMAADRAIRRQGTRSSVATFPVARGGNGQPPRPPIDESRMVAPASSAPAR